MIAIWKSVGMVRSLNNLKMKFKMGTFIAKVAKKVIIESVSRMILLRIRSIRNLIILRRLRKSKSTNKLRMASS